jgi:hypothetical protein
VLAHERNPRFLSTTVLSLSPRAGHSPGRHLDLFNGYNLGNSSSRFPPHDLIHCFLPSIIAIVKGFVDNPSIDFELYGTSFFNLHDFPPSNSDYPMWFNFI